MNEVYVQGTYPASENFWLSISTPAAIGTYTDDYTITRPFIIDTVFIMTGSIATGDSVYLYLDPPGYPASLLWLRTGVTKIDEVIKLNLYMPAGQKLVAAYGNSQNVAHACNVMCVAVDVEQIFEGLSTKYGMRPEHKTSYEQFKEDLEKWFGELSG